MQHITWLIIKITFLEKRPALAPISEETTANERNRQERSSLADNQEGKPTKDETHEQRKKV